MPALTACPRRWRAAPRRAGRRGFTLIEVMVTLTLIGIVVGTLLTVITRQQRFFGSAADVMELHDNLRQIGDLLPAELRGLSPRYNDLVTMSDSMIEARVATGSSIVCDTLPGRSTIILPPATLSTDAGLTSWANAPVQGDSLFVFDPRAALPDTMLKYTITGAPGVGACPLVTGFTKTAAEAVNGIRLTLDRPLSATTPRGAPIRFFRRVKYSLYQSPTDGQWYLGYRDFIASRAPQWSAIQPVAGPLLPYATAASGLQLQYFDSAGTALALSSQAPQVRRIDVIARAQSRSKMRTPGLGAATASGYYRDSIRVTVALRNY
jgi:prepilin-type N-terminal cleavage/methylation domain-containing protein